MVDGKPHRKKIAATRVEKALPESPTRAHRNWPLLIHQLCVAYPGTTPKDYEELTRDQLYVMMLGEEMLSGLGGLKQVAHQGNLAKYLTPEQIATEKKILGGYRSLAEKLNQEAKKKQRKQGS